MNAPYDTSLLKHLPDHLSPRTDAERAAEKLAKSNRLTFLEVFRDADTYWQWLADYVTTKRIPS